MPRSSSSSSIGRLSCLVAVVCIAVVALPASAALVWTRAASDTILTAPAVGDGAVYVGTGLADGQLRCIDATTGALRWSYFPGAGSVIASTPAVSNGLVYVGSSTNKLSAVSTATGAVVWFQLLSGSITNDILVASGVVYFGSDNNNFYALDATTGAILRTFDAGSPVRGSAALHAPSMTITFGCLDGQVVALNATTFVRLWNYTASAAAQTTIVITSNNVVVVGVDDGDVYGLFLASGLLKFRFRAASPQARTVPLELNGVIYVGCTDGALYAYESQFGGFQWKLQVTSDVGGFVASPVYQRGFLFFAVSDGTVRALNLSTRQFNSPSHIFHVSSNGVVSQKPLALINSLVVLVTGSSVTAVNDPTIIPVTAEPQAGTTTTTAAPTAAPQLTQIGNPQQILAAHGARAVAAAALCLALGLVAAL